tara:strand:+ start:1453 stop:1695 length:243 start_codon:yes stop_codon:yes gene_type:complete
MKLEKSELEEIKQIGIAENSTLSNLGDVTYKLDLLRTSKKELIERLNTINERKHKHAEAMREKYGEGEINLNTGEFTSTK